jgi:hypothetical protein
MTRTGQRIIAALALVFVMVGANPPWSVQAAPANDYLGFVMTAVPSAEYVCVGQSMTFDVKISRQLIPHPGDTGPKFDDVGGVLIEAAGAENLGRTVFYGTMASNHLPPSVYYFEFKAGTKPGKSQIHFQAMVPASHGYTGQVTNSGRVHVDTFVPVDVRKCGYNVEMLFLEPMYGYGLLTGTANQVYLEQTSATHFKGFTELDMAYNFSRGIGCPITGQISSVLLDYSADLAGDTLYLNFSFPSLKATVTLTSCGDLPTTTTNSIDTAAGAGTVSVPSRGGLGVLSTPYWTYMFIVTLVPEE